MVSLGFHSMNLSQETLTDENGLPDAFMGFLVCLEQINNLFCLVMAVHPVRAECFLLLLCIIEGFLWTLQEHGLVPLC